MANETMTVNRLPALTWNWLKMNAARLEANAPAVGARPQLCADRTAGLQQRRTGLGHGDRHGHRR